MTGDIPTRAFDTAQRVVQVAVSEDFGELRDEMAAETLSAVLLDTTVQPIVRIALAQLIAQHLATTVRVLSDEMRGA